MAIQNLLSLNFLVPFVAMKNDFSRAIRGLRGMPRRLLLIGHRRSFALAPLNKIISISNEADALDLLGEASPLMMMWRAAKANADLGLPIDVLAVGFGNSPVAASSTVEIHNAAGDTNPFVVGGEVMLYIGGIRVAIGVSTADTPATAATKLIAAVNANPKLPVTAGTTANTNECKLTVRYASTLGNLIDLRAAYRPDEALPAGLTMVTPAFTGGVGTPDLSVVADAMVDYRATEIACAFTDVNNLVLLEQELARRWEANNMQDGQLCVCLRGTESGLTTALSSRNSPHVHVITTHAELTNPWETAAMAAAAIESSAAIDPAKPVTGIPLIGFMGPRQGDGWTIDQVNNLLVAGGMPLQIQPDYTATLLRGVTTYKQTISGSPDRSMAELAWLKTMSYKRWFTVSEWMTKYVGYKLAQYLTEPIPGQKIMTQDLAQEVMLGIYRLFMEAGLCQNFTYYRDTMVIEIDAPNGKVKIVDEPVLVTQHYQTEITSQVVAGQV